MTSIKRIQFSADIAAPAGRVFELMLRSESYQQWASAFADGSYFEGSWQQGRRMKFLVPSGDGMVAEVAEHRPGEFISLKHLGYINKGVEDTESESVRAWAPAFENYTFVATPSGTRLVVDQDVTEEYESYMVEAWPQALQRLKSLCETGSSG